MVKYEVYYLGNLVKTFLSEGEAEEYIKSCLEDEKVIYANEFKIKKVIIEGDTYGI